MDEKLILSIKPNKELNVHDRSACYDIYINDWKLGRGVYNATLEMPAGEKPKLTIECCPDLIEIDDALVETVFKERDRKE